MRPNYYKILGITKDATQEEIKQAYRKLVLKLHPDRTGNDPELNEKFKSVQEAFETLGEEQSRKQYDGVAHPFADQLHSWGDDNVWQYIFRNAPRQNRGQHVETEVSITYLEASKGCLKEITIDRRHICSACQGSGAKDGVAVKDCVACDGTGRQIFTKTSLRVETTCNVCRGNGKVVAAICPECSAKGFISKNVALTIEIPPGIDNGSKICIKEQGDVGVHGTGNLYCTIRLEPHSLFQRRGLDLVLKYPITYSQAVLGDVVEVPILEGTSKLDIPAGTKAGAIFRLAGLGFSSAKHCGDLVVHVEIDVPKRVEGRYAELIQELKELEKDNVGPIMEAYKRKIDGGIHSR